MVITLIGYRGSGKTTVARSLAARLGWSWADADAVIEESSGCTIKEIFETEGEGGFRERERRALAELLRRDRLVLAAGGGAILNRQTRCEMKSAGPVVWLRASVAELAARIDSDPATAARRPNLASGGIDEISRLLAEREPLYRECASLCIDTDGLAVAEVVEHVTLAVSSPSKKRAGFE
jgi:shikimate kinase